VAPPSLPGVPAGLVPLLDHWGDLGVAAVVFVVFVEGFGVPVPGETVVIALIWVRCTPPVNCADRARRGPKKNQPRPPISTTAATGTITSAMPMTAPRLLSRFQVPPCNPDTRTGSGCHQSDTGAAAWLAVRSYLDSARKHGINAFDAIRRAFTGNLWMPPIAQPA